MGFACWRRATTTPVRQTATKRGTCHPSEKSRAGQARGTYKTASTSVSAPKMTAVVADAKRKRRAVTSVITGACPPAGWPTLTEHTLRPGRSGNVTAQPGHENQCWLEKDRRAISGSLTSVTKGP